MISHVMLFITAMFVLLKIIAQMGRGSTVRKCSVANSLLNPSFFSLQLFKNKTKCIICLPLVIFNANLLQLCSDKLSISFYFYRRKTFTKNGDYLLYFMLMFFCFQQLFLSFFLSPLRLIFCLIWFYITRSR